MTQAFPDEMISMEIMNINSLRVLLAALLISLAPAQGLAIEVKKIPPLEALESFDEQDFLNRTRLVEMAPEESPELAFQMRMPKSWETSEDIGLKNYVLSSKLVGELMRYYSPPLLDKRSSVSVSAMEMEYKITAKHWLVYHLLSSGYSIEGIKEIDNNHVIAEYVMLERDEPYHVRAAAVSFGKTVLLAQYYAPLKTHEQEKSLQVGVINSFRALNPQESEGIPKDVYSFLDLAEFEYPLTWELRTPVIRNIDRMQARLMNVLGEGQLRGQITVNLISEAIPDMELEEEIARVNKETLGEHGFVLGHKIEKVDDFHVHSSIDKAVMEVYRLEFKERNIGYEYWFSILSHTDYYYYIIDMLTPSRDRKFYLWAKNVEVYKDVVESLKTGVEGLYAP